MISINVTPTDILRMRFAFSPMMEAVISFHMLIHKAKPPPAQYIQWVEEAERALYNLELPYMRTLIGNYSYIPSFLTPTPTAPVMDFEEDIKRLQATPHEIIVEKIQFMTEFVGEREDLSIAMADPERTIRHLVDELRLYWERTLAHHWSRMIAILENDILYRAREQALFGASDMLNAIHPMIGYEDGSLVIRKKWHMHKEIPDQTGHHYDIAGRGLQLVPAIFSYPKMYWQFGETYDPMFIYGTRGTGLWHYAEPEDPEEALKVVFGMGRSRVLYALTTPRSTGELAHLLQITSGAVSQHLNKLSQAGLVESSRSGKRVFYRLSHRGQALIDLFS